MDLTLQQVLLANFQTSGEGYRQAEELRKQLGFSTQYNVARLALGRSLSHPTKASPPPDAKGHAIRGSLLFGEKDAGLWVALIIANNLRYEGPKVETLADLQSLVRQHWSRGIQLLSEDWVEAEEDYDQFVATLIERRASLPESVVKQTDAGVLGKEMSPPTDITVLLVQALRTIGVQAEVTGRKDGSRISRYFVYMHDINQLDKIRRGLDKIQLALNVQASGIRLGAGDQRNTISLDIPRPKSSWVNTGIDVLDQWLHSPEAAQWALPIWLGTTVSGEPFGFDLTQAPHVLVAGTTGSGKSRLLHVMLLSLLKSREGKNLELALIDTKQVELAAYRRLTNLYRGAIATTPTDALEMLDELVVEMESRYKRFSTIGVSDIQAALANGESMPYIAVFIEEFADLLMQSQAAEQLVIKLAQKARAAGIHLVVATQRPDAKILSGLIRSNIPSRIALSVQKSTESKIILDDVGAEMLIGAGDMLASIRPRNVTERVQALFVDPENIGSAIKRL